MNWNLGFTIFINQWWLYTLEYKIEIIKKKQIDKNYIYIYIKLALNEMKNVCNYFIISSFSSHFKWNLAEIAINSYNWNR